MNKSEELVKVSETVIIVTVKLLKTSGPDDKTSLGVKPQLTSTQKY